MRKRPTAVLVMAILNMVFGGMGLACSLCLGFSIAFLAIMFNQPDFAKEPGMRDLKDMVESMNREIPWMFPYLIGNAVLDLVLAIVLLVAGIGLLKMRPWARITSIVYAVVRIATQIGGVVFTYGFINPAAERWQQNFLARHGHMQADAGPFGNNPLVQGAMGVVSIAMAVAYAIALLIVMFLPQVRAAFAAPDVAQDYEEKRAAEDEEDFGYERRREDEGWGGKP
jgi:hypothetical protein